MYVRVTYDTGNNKIEHPLNLPYISHHHYHSSLHCSPYWNPSSLLSRKKCGSLTFLHTSPWQQDPNKKAVVEKAVDTLKEKKTKSVSVDQFKLEMEEEGKVESCVCVCVCVCVYDLYYHYRQDPSYR